MDQELVKHQEGIHTQNESKKRKNKKVTLILAVLFIVFLGIFGLFNVLKPTTVPQVSAPQTKSTPSIIVIPAPSAQVVITKDGFSPETITVRRGTQVTWTNEDRNPHQIASDPHPAHKNLPGFDSPEPLLLKESYSYTFEKTGTFTYHDHLNPLKLKGTVIVE